MNRKANETFEMVTRTGDFAITSVGLFPKTSAATEIAAALQAGVKTLKEEARNIASAEMALRSCGSVRSTARENLNIMLGHVSTIGEALNSTRFSLPAKRRDRTLIDTGRAFAVEAEPLAKEFAKHGIRIEAITATVQALEEAIRSGAKARAARKTTEVTPTSIIAPTAVTATATAA
jgi:ATP phosphoribosyltransferase regulatory subunit HisZ